MAFDSKYFTGSDSDSYFTESSKQYSAASGMIIGEETGVGRGPFESAKIAAQHGFQTFMFGMHNPGAPALGREDMPRALDIISDQQLDATGEMLRLNKMNFSIHGPIIDLLGFSSNQEKAQAGFSAKEREENVRIFEKVIQNTDRISQNADLKNVPITVHPQNSMGPQNEWFDSGYRDNDGNIIYGKTKTLIRRDTGQLIPADSTFKRLKMTKEIEDSSLYSKIENTEERGYALYEITPEESLRAANSTYLNDIQKGIADAEIKMNQIESIEYQKRYQNQPYDENTMNALRENLKKNNAGYRDLDVEISTKKTELNHLTNPDFSKNGKPNIFSNSFDYLKEVFPEQINRLAMASYKTVSQPVLAIENMPTHIMGSPQEIVELIDESRKKFTETLREKEGLSYDDAKKKSQELIGAVLDIGHLNMFKSKINPATKKYWTDDDLKKEAEKMAKTGVKLVHIADNIGEFGKDSHLMIGRGNAKINEMLDILKQNGFQGQAVTESYEKEMPSDSVWARTNMRTVGSMYQSGRGPSFMDVDFTPRYSMPSNNYGHNLPDIHFGMWGGPFAGLQSTFSAAGARKDSYSGTPTS